MGKKKKRSVPSNSGTDISKPSNTLLDDIIEHLILIKESKGLVIGSNAVFRGIEKRSVDIVLLVSRNAFSALYHAMRSYCKNTDILFFQLRDSDAINLNSKIPASAAYGIKVKALNDKEKFSKLSEKIDRARSLLRCQREAKDTKCEISDESPICQRKEETEESRTEEEVVSVKSLLHSKHTVSKSKAPSRENFCSLDEYSIPDFPNYLVLHEKMSMSIK